jgi:subfamily B ATP-binding cassette protein HlyB/CyaB
MYFGDIFKSFIAEHPFMVLVNLLFMGLSPMNDVLLPHLYGKLVESVRNGKDFKTIFFIIILTLVVIQLGGILFDLHDTVFNPAFQSHLRNKMLNTIFKKYNTAFDELSIGGIVTTMIKAPGILLTWYSRVKDHIIPYVFVFVSAAIYFIFYDTLLGVSLIALIVTLAVIMVFSPRACTKIARKKANIYGRLYEEVDDVLRNLLSVYTSNKTVEELERFKDFDKVHQQACSQTMRCALLFKVISFPIVVGFFALFIYRCNALVRKGKIPVAAFVSLLLIFIGMMNNLMWIVDIIRDITFDNGFLMEAESRFAQLDNADVPIDHTLPVTPPYKDGIGLYNVSFAYEKTREPVIENMTLHFAPGEKVVISGPIGTGKSTVSKLLERLYLPSKGDLYLDGKWYSTLTPVEIRKHVGYVPQQAVLFNRSIYENIKYGNDPTKVTDAYVDKLIADLEIESEFSNMADGLKTRVGKNGSKLSGGQRQLVWCLRTLIRNPEVVVLDEPTASMDEKTKNLLNKIIEHLMKGKTVIMITHDEYLVQRATRIVTLPIDADHATANKTNSNNNNGVYGTMFGNF